MASSSIMAQSIEEIKAQEVTDQMTLALSLTEVEKEKVYREAGLTISTLAKTLNLPEYRLRAFIHKQLGFRNFNAMLHE